MKKRNLYGGIFLLKMERWVQKEMLPNQKVGLSRDLKIFEKA